MKNWRRRVAIGAVILGLVFAIGWGVHRSVLVWLGDLMVTSDPQQPADIAIMTDGSQIAGALEVADLFHGGLVARVGIMVPQANLARREMARRGIVIDDPYQMVLKLNVPAPAVVRIPTGSGTTGETDAMAAWCRTNGIRRVTLVTTAEHARRLRRMFLRASGKQPIVATIDLARFDIFRPDDWWLRRDTLRTGLVELQKVLLDHVMYPLN